MSNKPDKWARAQAPVQEAPPLPPPLPIRIHFQKSIMIRLGGTAALAGVQGLGNLTTDTAQILASDAGGMLLALEGKCAFIPWANVAWIEQL